MANISTNDPKGSQTQNALVWTGKRAVVSASPLAFASLANGQTFVTLNAAGATLSRTIDAPLAASTTLATFCAALAAQLNLDGTGYNWTATATTVVGTAKLPGSAFNSAPTGTALVGGVGSIATTGVDPYSATSARKIDNLPANTSAELALKADDYFVGTAGAGNLAANSICYYSAGTSTLLPARANAVATARKIMGCTTVAVTASASAILVRRRPFRVLCAADCVPVIGAKVYLSGATAGTVTSVLTASMYPAMVGYFLEGAIDGDNTVLVGPALDDSRDDVTDFPLSMQTLGAASPTLSLTFTRAFFRSAHLVLQNIGPATGNFYFSLSQSRSRVMLSPAGDGPVNSYSSGAGGVYMFGNGGGAAGACVGTFDTDVMPDGTAWNGMFRAWNVLGAQGISGSARTETYHASPADTIAFDASGVNMFVSGTRLELTARRRIA